MAEPKNNKEKLTYLLKVGEIEEATIEHLAKAIRLNSLLHMTHVTEESLKDAFKEDVFGSMEAETILTLKAWIDYVRSTNNNQIPTPWVETFTAEKFFDFASDRPDKTDQVTPDVVTSGASTVKHTVTLGNPKMSDYPTFSGKMEDWYQFKDQFEGTAQGQGLGWVLEEHTEKSDTLRDDTFKANSAFIYSVLKRNCAKGNAAVKIRKFANEANGYEAWRNLKNYYESHGSIDQYVADCTNEIYKLKLEWNSQAGFERYVSEFETLCLRLEEAKNPLTEIQKKTRFLSGINDKDYNEIIAICHHDDSLDFEATVRKVRSEAKAKGKLRGNKPT
jgi:hypothetical protein